MEDPDLMSTLVTSKESSQVTFVVSARMAKIGCRDTTPEILLRKALFARGMRYRVCIRPMQTLRRTADVVFTRARVAVFIDGCFWHQCPDHYRPATLRK